MLLEVHPNEVPLTHLMRQEIHRRRRGLARYQGYLQRAVLTMNKESEGTRTRYRCRAGLEAACGRPMVVESVGDSVARCVRQAFRRATRATRAGLEEVIV